MKFKKIELMLVGSMCMMYGLTSCGSQTSEGSYDYDTTGEINTANYDDINIGETFVDGYIMDLYSDHAIAEKYCGLETKTIMPNTVSYTDNDGKNLELPVIAVESKCFESNEFLESITIPNNVQRIENYAFYDEPSLKEINLGDSIQYIGSMDLKTPKVDYLIIPEACTTIGTIESILLFFKGDRGGFESSGLTSYNYGRAAFYKGEWKLVNGKPVSTYQGSVVIDGLAYDLFENGATCTGVISSLKSTCVIPASIEAFSSKTNSVNTYKVLSVSFYEDKAGYNQSVTELDISEGIVLVEGYALYKLSNLKKIKIPSSVVYISEYLFSRSGLYAEVSVDPANKSFKSENGCLIRLSDMRLMSVVDVDAIPDGVKIIGSYSLRFSEASENRKIVFPDSVERIEKYIYDTNDDEITFEFGKNVKYFSRSFINNETCKKSSINYKGSLRDWFNIDRREDLSTERGMFRGASTSLYLQDDNGNFSLLPESFTVPDDVVKINNGLFYNIACNEVTIGSNVTRVDDYAFGGRCGINTVHFAKSGLKYIGNYVFYGSSQAILDSFPDTLEHCGGGGMLSYTFVNKEFIWPKSLKSISSLSGNAGNRYNCEKIVYQGTISDWISVKTDGDITKFYTDNIYFKDGDTEKLASSYTEVTVPEGTRFINPDTFKVLNITNLVLPASVKTIEDSAFSGVTSVKSIEFKGNLEYIGTYAFKSTLLNSFVSPDSVDYIGNNAFESTYLSDVKLPNHSKYIGSEAFKGSYGIRKIIVPEDTAYLGKNVFDSNDNTILVFLEASSVPEAWDSEWLYAKESTPKDEEGNYIATYYLKDHWSLVNGVPTPNN